MRKYLNNKKIIITAIVVVLTAIIGVSYALYEHYEETSSRRLVAGDIFLELNDGSETISLTNVMPELTSDARDIVSHNPNDETNNTLTFVVNGRNTSNNDLYYEITLNYGNEYGQDNEPPYQRFRDQDLVFDLEEIDSEGNRIGDYLVSEKSYPNINNQRMYSFTVPAHTDNYSKRFRVRMWLSSNVLISDTDPNRSYYATGNNAFKYHYGSVKIGVVGDFKAKARPGILYSTIENLATGETPVTYVKSYTAEVLASNPTFTINDTVEDLEQFDKREVYYFTGDDAAANGNLLFAGYCWQIVRTTQDGGIKILYNGKAENNQCLTTRTGEKTINGATTSEKVFVNQTYQYADSYDYNLVNGTFTLINPYSAVWTEDDNDNDGIPDYKKLIGKYSFADVTNSKTIYYIGDKKNNGEPSLVKYTIGNASQTIIGSSAFNASAASPTMVGYMFNDSYFRYADSNENSEMASTTFGYDVIYDNETDKYTLQNTKADGVDDNHHYRCEEGETTTTCSVVRYYTSSYNGTYYYIKLQNGERIEDALHTMLNYKENNNIEDININQYNSSIKGLIDNWYVKNILQYANFLDKETVFCNNRKMVNNGSYAGWLKNGSLGSSLTFQGSESNKNLHCDNMQDRFSTENNNAKLTYPVGLLTENERNMMGANYAKTNGYWWLASPNYFYNYGTAGERVVNSTGGSNVNVVTSGYGARPLVSLAPGSDIIGGNGTYEEPYVINYVN